MFVFKLNYFFFNFSSATLNALGASSVSVPVAITNLSASQSATSSFLSTCKSFAITVICSRLARRSPRSILLYIGVPSSNAAANWV
jgi:hypothetical protein